MPNGTKLQRMQRQAYAQSVRTSMRPESYRNPTGILKENEPVGRNVFAFVLEPSGHRW